MAKKVPCKLNYLRVTLGKNTTIKPCTAEMESLLTCWRHQGVDATACAGIAAALAMCTAKAAANPSSVVKGTRPLINNVLRQMFPLR